MADQPEVVDLARQAADRLALFTGLHPTPLNRLHMTTLVVGPDGRLLSAPHTFARKADAARWLMLKEAEIHRGEWIDPEHAGVSFGDYAHQWLQDRVLKVRTRELYDGLLRNHLDPASAAWALPT